MSKTLWANASEINQSIQAVRNDNDPTQWTLVGWNDKFDTLQVVGSGTGTVEEFVPHLQETSAYYA
jgi:hypothetical protein